MNNHSKKDDSEIRTPKSALESSALDMLQERIKYLRENTDFVATLFESLVGYAIIAADFDGNIIAYNEGARQIYGYGSEEIIGKENFELFFPEDFIKAGGLQQIIADLMGKERYACEGEKVRKNGHRFPAHILFTLTKDKDGKVVGFIEIVEDLTARNKAAEVTLRARENDERIDRLEKELHSLATLSSPPQTGVTARMYGTVILMEGFPDTFRNLVNTYGELMDLALEQQAFKVKHDISGRLASMAETLGFYKAGPRDVVDIHTTALKEKTRETAAVEKRKAYTGEGWIMVLELMGHLASFYRNRASCAGVSTPPEA